MVIRIPAIVIAALLFLPVYLYADEIDDAVKAAEAGNLDYAIGVFHKYAEQGNSAAQYALGRLYVEKQNPEEGIKWYLKAAEQGRADAQNSLGMLYWKGEGAPQDIEKALFWLNKSSDQGNQAAQYNLELAKKAIPMAEAFGEYFLFVALFGLSVIILIDSKWRRGQFSWGWALAAIIAIIFVTVLWQQGILSEDPLGRGNIILECTLVTYIVVFVLYRFTTKNSAEKITTSHTGTTNKDASTDISAPHSNHAVKLNNSDSYAINSCNPEGNTPNTQYPLPDSDKQSTVTIDIRDQSASQKRQEIIKENINFLVLWMILGTIGFAAIGYFIFYLDYHYISLNGNPLFKIMASIAIPIVSFVRELLGFPIRGMEGSSLIPLLMYGALFSGFIVVYVIINYVAEASKK